MTAPNHPTERLADLLDERLTAAETAAMRQHVDGCAECRRELELISGGRGAARQLRTLGATPPDLLARIHGALDDLDAAAAPDAARPHRYRRAVWAALAAAAAVLLYVAAPWRPTTLDAADIAQVDFSAIVSGSTNLELRGSDPAALERYFNDSARGPRVRVIDLAMMGWTLEGGVQHRFQDQPSALYSYRSASGARLVCQMYRGRLEDLPATGDVRRQNGFEFRIYTRRGVTLVFWNEGEILCVLASDLPAGDVADLAVAKAMAPA